MIHIRRKLRQVIWVGNSKAELVEFPKPIQKDIGDGLFIAQGGSCHRRQNRLRELVQGFLRYVLIIELIPTAQCIP